MKKLLYRPIALRINTGNVINSRFPAIDIGTCTIFTHCFCEVTRDHTTSCAGAERGTRIQINGRKKSTGIQTRTFSFGHKLRTQ